MNSREKCRVSVLIPAKNEANNIARALDPLHDWADQIYVIDSQSTDRTAEIARDYGAEVVQFHYRGGWPKKRQWALDTLDLRNDWILLVDADEIITGPLKDEISRAIQDHNCDGYFLRYRIFFLGRELKYGGTGLYKLFLFRKGKARFEQRLKDQDQSMLDMEVHEHVVVDGKVGKLKNPVRHENLESLDRYIEKHNHYSNWEAMVYLAGENSDLQPSLFGSQAQRRRALKRMFVSLPGVPVMEFLYRYVICLGFLDGVPGLYYALFKAVYTFNIKAKIYELNKAENAAPPEQ